VKELWTNHLPNSPSFAPWPSVDQKDPTPGVLKVHLQTSVRNKLREAKKIPETEQFWWSENI